MSVDEVHAAASKVVGKENVRVVGSRVQMISQNAPQGVSIRPTIYPPRSRSIPFYYPD